MTLALKDGCGDHRRPTPRRLIALSERLHAHPETAWEEHRAAVWVGEALSEAGFSVTPGLPRPRDRLPRDVGNGPFRLGLCAEYDALPGLGHACGHNLIAAIAVGAALGPGRRSPTTPALTVEVYGTPAEEGGGGKIEMLERGAFAGLDLAMMAHPARSTSPRREPFAVDHSHVSYRGKAAHAAAYPEHGVNAADAFTIAQVAIGPAPPAAAAHGPGARRGDPRRGGAQRHPRRTPRAAGTSARESLAELAEIEEKVWRCFQAGALATGCELEIEPESKPYAEFRNDEAALRVLRRERREPRTRLRAATRRPRG